MVLAALVLLGAVCAAGLIGFVYYKETHLPPVGEFDTIIVLGAQVKADGTPSVALERRLTAALEEYRKQPRLMIVCGAQGSDEPRAEGDVMRDWLIAHGVAAAYISTNLANSIVFAVLIVVLLVKPAGLLGKSVTEKV